MTRIKLSSIEMDTSIQCRASIDTATVSEYAERMTEGDEFPPVIVYGTSAKCWIADGWHRIMAAKQVGLPDIAATVTPGGRIDALKAALSANAAHGIRRGNADKRRAVEIALREFPKLSSRMIAELCGVSDKTVGTVRETCGISARDTRIDSLGRNQPATRRTSVTFAPPEPAEYEDEDPQADEDGGAVPPAEQNPEPIKTDAVAIADRAIFYMTQIGPRMNRKEEALKMVIEWCKKQLKSWEGK